MLLGVFYAGIHTLLHFYSCRMINCTLALLDKLGGCILLRESNGLWFQMVVTCIIKKNRIHTTAQAILMNMHSRLH
jgi:hypothetical protein